MVMRKHIVRAGLGASAVLVVYPFALAMDGQPWAPLAIGVVAGLSAFITMVSLLPYAKGEGR